MIVMDTRVAIGEVPDLPIPRYERRGQCNRCGWCCQFEDCEHFVPAEDEELAMCLIYEEPRPLKCERFPELPPILHDECGFRFYDKWEKKLLGVREV